MINILHKIVMKTSLYFSAEASRLLLGEGFLPQSMSWKWTLGLWQFLDIGSEKKAALASITIFWYGIIWIFRTRICDGSNLYFIMLSFALRFCTYSHSGPGDIVRVWLKLVTTLPMFVQVVVAQKASENSTMELALKMWDDGFGVIQSFVARHRHTLCLKMI